MSTVKDSWLTIRHAQAYDVNKRHNDLENSIVLCKQLK